MPLGLIIGIGRSMRRKRTSSLDILSSKRAPRDYYKGKNCKPTGFHTRKGGYVVVQEKLPNYVVPVLTDFKIHDPKFPIFGVHWKGWKKESNSTHTTTQ
ncbi:hypothetical protein Dsin_002827 [Dipteronia sinensis]|uniref:Ribosomal protein L27 n=1 Tax=Dipteronia sinensis TaxID=43782 RepID=A0AAE0EJS7_9ROSI|nr:hypothetical protein Dsin_002827 [Dipteronia sinensis]